MEDLMKTLEGVLAGIKQIEINFSKDSASRKTREYIEKRLDRLDKLWADFKIINDKLSAYEHTDDPYFTEGQFARARTYYESVRQKIASSSMHFVTEKAHEINPPSTPTTPGQMKSGTPGMSAPPLVQVTLPTAGHRRTEQAAELLSMQRTNFRSFDRTTRHIKVDEIKVKWELEDELKSIQNKWKTIDELHLQIDNILQGSEPSYDEEFFHYEELFRTIKKALNEKLASTAHLQNATPKLEVPVFGGLYTKWPTFLDLYSESIHNNHLLTNCQKMQHLKSKLKGEPERLVQHLHVSSENYETAWELLNHRYNNPQVLFTKHIELFLNQSVMQKQTAHDIKRIYDTSMENIHAIENLGIDISTWDPILVHLISKKLDPETYGDYKEARKSPRDIPKLKELLDFLESKFIALEPINKKERDSASYQPKLNNTSHQQQRTVNNKYNPQYQGQGRYRQNYGKSADQEYRSNACTNSCPHCNGNHALYRCQTFRKLKPENLLKAFKKLGVCKNCLTKHDVGKCYNNRTCRICSGDHNSLLHDAFTLSITSTLHPTSAGNDSDEMMQQEKQQSLSLPSTSRDHRVNHVASEDEEILLPTMSIKIKSVDGTFITLTALLDQGSQISLISEKAVQLLGLPRENFNASVWGIGDGSKQGRGIVSLDIESIYGNFNFTTQAMVIPRVIKNLPNTTFKRRHWAHLDFIQLADPDYNLSKPIDLLLDASVYSEIIMNGLIKGPDRAPIAQQTKMGWILSGNVKTFNCNVVINNIEELSKYWELEEISDPTELTTQEKYCEELYQRTTRRLEDGSYEVAIPMKPYFERNLGTSKNKAIAQFYNLENKMSANIEFSESYKQFMSDYEKLGHMKRVQCINNISCYLPHHGVLKADSTTTKLRTVFNASSKTSTGKSLNDLMERGPNLQKDLQSLILIWRHHKYVVTADIEKMFRTIYIRKQDQPLHSIIWRPSPQQSLGEFTLTTLTYGTKSAPYLAMRTLKQIAIDNEKLRKYPLAVKALKNSFYMDDLLEGGDTIEETRELQQQVLCALAEARMNIRKWSSNAPELTKYLPEGTVEEPLHFKCGESRKTLGLSWKSYSDTFTFQNKFDDVTNTDKLTKRQLLSFISKIFDPLGWLSPLTVRAKLLFQRTWVEANDAWDAQLPCEVTQEWHQLKTDFQNLEKFQIPRYLGDKQYKYEIHGFCDASEKAYACAIYIVTINNKGEYTSRLITAKTKLAPVKNKLTLPRLELCGALLLSRLMEKVLETFTEKEVTMYAWTDSMIVLGWIYGGVNKWKEFVANRILSILKIIPASSWHHVRSEDNAADCATRGMSATQLLENLLWWEGPKWLHDFDPALIKNKIYKPHSVEAKKLDVNVAFCESKNENIILKLLNECNSIQRVATMTGWLLRYIKWLRGKQSTCKQNYLSVHEMSHAYNLIIRTVQQFEFSKEISQLKRKERLKNNSKLLCLNPVMEEQTGLLKVGGRLNNSYLQPSTKHPIILPSHSRLTELIIDQAHKITLHGGPSLTLTYLREKYWILSGLRTVKHQLRKCVKCRRHTDQTRPQIMGDLPEPRVTPSRPFTHTGVDFTGHFDIKANKGRGVRTTKGYVCVFVCLSTKAVHLELVSDLSTQGFLGAFRRFCSRRGTPSDMYSDNGTNFVGADGLLKKEYKAIINTIDSTFFNKTKDLNIQWHFNAPANPSAGGLWEAAVKRMKYHLKRVVGSQKLTYEEFTTVIHQIEACLNSRPLIALTENPDDMYLTPGHFLIGNSLLSRPLTEPDHMNLTTRWQMVQAMCKDIWKKWSSDYLQQLQVRSKWRTPTKNIEIDDIVLVKEENLPPGKWAIGRVVDVHPGTDGHVRIVSVKTKNGVIKRPCIKLSVLPVTDYPLEHLNYQATANDSKANEHEPRIETLKPRRGARQGRGICQFVTMALLLFLTILSPVQGTYNVTSLDQNQSIYFDKICDMNVIRDEWKLIVYYNMSAYWTGLYNINNYVEYLNHYLITTTTKLPIQYKGIVYQLQQEISEIEHYNSILRNQNGRRKKRGLINGVGYLANTLFGVLDDSFAKRYEMDIEKISLNENHLKLLLKNQTSVLEAQYNIMQRNEAIMNKQFGFIGEQLQDIQLRMREVQREQLDELNILSLSFSANSIITSLRRIQDNLIDTITDLSHGHIDSHLLPPEQLQEQANVISGHLRGDLTLACDKHNIREIYKLMKVNVKVGEKYLIIEIKIPLINKDTLEIDHLISLPHSNHIVRFATPYIAFNLQKNLLVPMTETDIQACVHTTDNRLLCPIDKPIYELPITHSICDININNNTELCNTDKLPCQERWIKLQYNNRWLYSCCAKCSIRIFCADDMQIKTLTGNGIIDIGQGCLVKSNSITIYGHNNYLTKMKIEGELPVIPEYSILNIIVNSSTIPVYVPENHTHEWAQLKTQIETLKAQSDVSLTVHDVHQYTVMYIILAMFILAVPVIIIIIRRLKARFAAGSLTATFRAAPEEDPKGPRQLQASSVEMCSLSVSSLDKATSISPKVTPRVRTVKLNIPIENNLDATASDK